VALTTIDFSRRTRRRPWLGIGGRFAPLNQSAVLFARVFSERHAKT
jgi:hypothetical protein